jgi:hypothetical protein
MNKVLIAILLFFGLSLCARNADAQAVQIGAQMTATAATNGTGIATPTTYYHQLTWTTYGSVATCTLRMDSSPDNSSWTNGGTIAAQTCTSGGSSPLTNTATAYARIDLATFTCTAGSTCGINISYIGYSSGPSGTVQSGAAAPTGTCTSGAIYTITGSGIVYSCKNGSWLITPAPQMSYSSVFMGGQVSASQTATTNSLRVCAVIIPFAVSFSQIGIYMATGDNSGDLYSVGLYNSSGVLVAHSTPASYTTSGDKTIATVEGLQTIQPGKYYFGWTGNASTAALGTINTGTDTPNSENNNGATTASGAQVASFTPAADAWDGSAQSVYYFVLHQ